MATPTYAVAGEALVDVVVTVHGDRSHAPGGSPLNVAVGLARLGIDTVLLTQIGDDELGRLVREHVVDSDVTLPPGSVLAGHPTSTATAHLDERGAATYTFDLHWTLEPRDLPAGVDGLHVGSIGAAVRPGRDTVVSLVQQAADRGLLVSFDPNARPSFTPDPHQAWLDVLEIASAARVVKLSDEDLRFLQPGRPVEDLAERLLDDATELVVVTFGGDGAHAFSRHGTAQVASSPTRVVDTVGAGDSFMAALLTVVAEHGLADLDGARLTAYLAAAHEAASITVSRRGADPPRRSELSPGWPHLSRRR